MPVLSDSDASDVPATERVVVHVLRACDMLFGAISVVLAVLGLWLLAVGGAGLLTVVALWSIPLIHLAATRLISHGRRATADLLRGAVCLPITAFLYISEDGLFDALWIPALVVTAAVSVSVSLSSRSLRGCLVSLGYAAALFITDSIAFHHFAISAFNDAFGIGLTGCIVSFVSSRLGRSMEETRSQHDRARTQKDRAEAVLLQLTQRSRELTAAVESLQGEMERRMRAELELHQAQKLESIGRLAAGVAHEINTPVQFVADSLQFVREGMTDMLGVVGRFGDAQAAASAGGSAGTEDADVPYLVENIPKALDLALDGLGRVATIVRSLKEFAHPDARQMAEADLNHAIETTLTMARNEWKYVAELDTEFGELPRVRCHIGELNQVVLNLVVNSAHAIGDVVKGSETKGRIRVRTYRDGDDAVIAISDTGGGIPDAIRDRIFEPFFTTKEVGRGTGQGLAIARTVIVDKHRGRLDLETSVGQGTTFTIRLPIAGKRGTAKIEAVAMTASGS